MADTTKTDAALPGLLSDIADLFDALSDLDSASREFIAARTAPVRDVTVKIRKLSVVPATRSTKAAA